MCLFTCAANGALASKDAFQPAMQWHLTPVELKAFEDKINLHLEGNTLVEANDAFLQVEFPKYIETCLMSDAPKDTLIINHINSVLQAGMRLIVKYLREYAGPLPQPILLILQHLWDYDQQGTAIHFYDHYGFQPQLMHHIMNSQKYLKMPHHHPDVHLKLSVFLIWNLNRFGEEGGFEALLHRVSFCPLAEVHTYVVLIFMCNNLFNREWGRQYFPKLTDAILPRASNLTTEDVNFLKGAQNQGFLEQLNLDMERLLQALYDHGMIGLDAVSEGFETMQLVQALKLLRCPYLNLRIRGISQINDLIAQTKRKEARKYSMGYGGSNFHAFRGHSAQRKAEPQTKWLYMDFLADWVARQEVVEVVLGDSEVMKKHGLEETHYELVKRSDQVLVVVAQKKLLRPNHIESLWRASLKQTKQQVTITPCIFRTPWWYQ